MSDEHEFKFRGQMYDCAKVKKVNGGYVFAVIEDNKESNLIEFLKCSFGQSNENTKNTKTPFSNLVKSFSKDFVGSFPKKIMLPSSSLTPFSCFKAANTCSGHFLILQNPPDSIYC